MLKKCDAFITAAPKKKFSKLELDSLQKWLEEGKLVVLMADEGGEDKLDSNFNFLLEKYNILANGDSVIRTSYFRYFHPMEVFIQHGVGDEDFLRVVNKEQKKAGVNKAKRMQLAFDQEVDDVNEGLPGYQFVYPYGCSLAVKPPSVAILTSGPISYPVNQPLCAYHKTKSGGILLVLGSYKFLTDDYIDKEDNSKFVVGYLSEQRLC